MKISDCMEKNPLFELRVNVLQAFSLDGQRFIQQSIAPFPDTDSLMPGMNKVSSPTSTMEEVETDTRRALLHPRKFRSRFTGSPSPIALLTPYTGSNFGDGAIQDAMIANMRLRFPAAQFSGISLNCENFVQRHGVDAYPVCATGMTFYGMARGGSTYTSQQIENSNQPKVLKWCQSLGEAAEERTWKNACSRALLA